MATAHYTIIMAGCSFEGLYETGLFIEGKFTILRVR